MIRKLISTLAIAFVAGCAGTAGDVESVGEGTEAISAVRASGDEVATAFCPTPFQCAKADMNCQDPIKDVYWCDMLGQCQDCGIYAAPTEETTAVVAGGDTQSAWCPTPFQCAKADMYCQDPIKDVYWCDMLGLCQDCGIYAAPTEETTAAVAGGDTQSATCPSAGVCAKADMYCQDPIRDVYWCNIFEQCFDCGIYGAAGEQTQ